MSTKILAVAVGCVAVLMSANDGRAAKDPPRYQIPPGGSFAVDWLWPVSVEPLYIQGETERAATSAQVAALAEWAAAQANPLRDPRDRGAAKSRTTFIPGNGRPQYRGIVTTPAGQLYIGLARMQRDHCIYEGKPEHLRGFVANQRPSIPRGLLRQLLQGANILDQEGREVPGPGKYRFAYRERLLEPSSGGSPLFVASRVDRGNSGEGLKWTIGLWGGGQGATVEQETAAVTTRDRVYRAPVRIVAQCQGGGRPVGHIQVYRHVLSVPPSIRKGRGRGL